MKRAAKDPRANNVDTRGQQIHKSKLAAAIAGTKLKAPTALDKALAATTMRPTLVPKPGKPKPGTPKPEAEPPELPKGKRVCAGCKATYDEHRHTHPVGGIKTACLAFRTWNPIVDNAALENAADKCPRDANGRVA